jgi:hypothetical protein
VVVLARDLDAVRKAITGWHLGENVNGALRPLLPGVPVRRECHQLWVRRDARSAWRMEFLVDWISTGTEWVFKQDESVRLLWDRAVHDRRDRLPATGVALLFKAEQDREKDRDDLAAARLTGDARAWLTSTLNQVGYLDWARLLEQATHATAVLNDVPRRPPGAPGASSADSY